MALEKIEELREELETDDVGQKRYVMYRMFDILVERVYELNDLELPDPEERVRGLQGTEGYLYKLSQDFLTSSSTMEKEERIEKMVDHVQKRLD